MEFFPISIRLAQRVVIFIGAGADAVPKIRLLRRAATQIWLFDASGPVVADALIAELVASGQVKQLSGLPSLAQLAAAALIYCERAAVRRHPFLLRQLASTATPYCVIDDLDNSSFITPALIDRDPVTIAIATEGTAPVLARQIKAMIEEILPLSIGPIARVAGAFRSRLNSRLNGSSRRAFWARYFQDIGPSIAKRFSGTSRDTALRQGLQNLLADYDWSNKAQTPPVVQILSAVQFVGAGPGDPDLLTMGAVRVLRQADVIIHDRLVSPEILELARREALVIEAGKTGFGSGWRQSDIHQLTAKHALDGHQVVRLKSGDSGIFGRLDEEIAALDKAGLKFEIIPGITTASAAAAAMGASLTRRGRNSEVRLLTAQDVNGFAEHDWQQLAQSGAVASIYMGLRAVPLMATRLLQHGAASDMAVTIAQNVSRPDARWLVSTVAQMQGDVKAAGLTGPVILMLGLAPHHTHILQDAEQGQDASYLPEVKVA